MTSRRQVPAAVTKRDVRVTPRHFTSLREFLDALRDLDDLREVNFKVDTDLEIGGFITNRRIAYGNDAFAA
jgi:hypothetical protein